MFVLTAVAAVCAWGESRKVEMTFMNQGRYGRYSVGASGSRHETETGSATWTSTYGRSEQEWVKQCDCYCGESHLYRYSGMVCGMCGKPWKRVE